MSSVRSTQREATQKSVVFLWAAAITFFEGVVGDRWSVLTPLVQGFLQVSAFVHFFLAVVFLWCVPLDEVPTTEGVGDQKREGGGQEEGVRRTAKNDWLWIAVSSWMLHSSLWIINSFLLLYKLKAERVSAAEGFLLIHWCWLSGFWVLSLRNLSVALGFE